ncbi:MAG: DUF4367 domain-containing protein [Oscillospiraceae bacterium]|nr:DUF4367 domain-containing protein [Oscillospiraceae bacterium]
MKDIANKQHGSPSNRPAGGDVFTKMLEAMTEEELTDGLNEALESMTEENYDPALIDAYLAALDRKAPMPEVPDSEAAFANFKTKLLQTFPAEDKADSPSRKTNSVWRIGLIAILTVICLMGGMVAAQASGVDVFGAIARWTDEVFSLGAIITEGTDDDPCLGNRANTVNDTEHYETLQEVLDAYGITEFREPTWLPDGYAFESVDVDFWPDDNSLIGLLAKYNDGANFLQIKIECYQGNANEQLEKVSAPVETLTVNGFTVYLLENKNSTSAAWVTEHYECYIIGTVEKQVLKQIVLSAYAHTIRR